jgi:hypothetical protein
LDSKLKLSGKPEKYRLALSLAEMLTDLDPDPDPDPDPMGKPGS